MSEVFLLFSSQTVGYSNLGSTQPLLLALPGRRQPLRIKPRIPPSMQPPDGILYNYRMSLYNVYCDESCHLENDESSVMVLGAIWCPFEYVSEANKRIREIIKHHDMSSDFEIKWSKVSQGKIDLYLDLVDYFFDNSNLSARLLVVPDKKAIDHTRFDQTHDDWYYKMYFTMLKNIVSPKDEFNIFIDIKDTVGSSKVARLHDVISNSIYDFDKKVVRKIQTVRSHEVAILQLADLIIGAVGYKNRKLSTSPGKMKIIDRIIERSEYNLKSSTLPTEKKFNYFIWRAG